MASIDEVEECWEQLAEVYGDVRYIPLIEGLKEPYSVCKSKIGGSCVQQR